jgi:hypothetical protein
MGLPLTQTCPGLQPLALQHVSEADGKVVLAPWDETDFRTGAKPWWT